jgi:outer membrane protein
MKNISLILNAVLAIAVATLFYWHFSSPKTATVAGKVSSEGSSIVFVNTDTLLENYVYFKKAKAELEVKRDAMENELSNANTAIQREFAAAQQRLSTMSASEARSTEERLGQKQQSLMQRKEELNDNFSIQMKKMDDELNDKIHNYLKNYNKDKNYKYILAYTRQSQILFADGALDITKEVLEGMNEEYKKEKK